MFVFFLEICQFQFPFPRAFFRWWFYESKTNMGTMPLGYLPWAIPTRGHNNSQIRAERPICAGKIILSSFIVTSFTANDVAVDSCLGSVPNRLSPKRFHLAPPLQLPEPFHFCLLRLSQSRVQFAHAWEWYDRAQIRAILWESGGENELQKQK